MVLGLLVQMLPQGRSAGAAIVDGGVEAQDVRLRVGLDVGRALGDVHFLLGDHDVHGERRPGDLLA